MNTLTIILLFVAVASCSFSAVYAVKSNKRINECLKPAGISEDTTKSFYHGDDLEVGDILILDCDTDNPFGPNFTEVVLDKKKNEKGDWYYKTISCDVNGKPLEGGRTTKGRIANYYVKYVSR